MLITLTFRRAILAVLAASIAVVGGALLFQYVGGLAPCELCLYERWPYYIAIVAAAVLLAAGRWRVTGGALLTLVFIASTALAFYHVGVEQHWFAGPTACTGSGAAAGSIDDLRAQLLHQQPVQCDQPQWALVGVTLAAWNLVASSVLAALSCVALGLALKEPRL
ncbi:MAG TPA: disulfide bond formation protein B [Stellaceae bacterium]|nr:disulfide bond formation protein B [Stellaceae bacterium]